MPSADSLKELRNLRLFLVDLQFRLGTCDEIDRLPVNKTKADKLAEDYEIPAESRALFKPVLVATVNCKELRRSVVETRKKVERSSILQDENLKLSVLVSLDMVDQMLSGVESGIESLFDGFSFSFGNFMVDLPERNDLLKRKILRHIKRSIRDVFVICSARVLESASLLLNLHRKINKGNSDAEEALPQGVDEELLTQVRKAMKRLGPNAKLEQVRQICRRNKQLVSRAMRYLRSIRDADASTN